MKNDFNTGNYKIFLEYQNNLISIKIENISNNDQNPIKYFCIINQNNLFKKYDLLDLYQIFFGAFEKIMSIEYKIIENSNSYDLIFNYHYSEKILIHIKLELFENENQSIIPKFRTIKVNLREYKNKRINIDPSYYYYVFNPSNIREIYLHKQIIEKNNEIISIDDVYYLSNIKELYIRYSFIIDLNGMHRYEVLYDENCFFWNEIENFNCLKTIYFDYFPDISLKRLKNNYVEELIIGSNIYETPLMNIFGYQLMPKLKKMKFIQCPKLFDITIFLNKYDHNIESLEFIECSNIDLHQLLNYCFQKNIKLIVSNKSNS